MAYHCGWHIRYPVVTLTHLYFKMASQLTQTTIQPMHVPLWREYVFSSSFFGLFRTPIVFCVIVWHVFACLVTPFALEPFTVSCYTHITWSHRWICEYKRYECNHTLASSRLLWSINRYRWRRSVHVFASMRSHHDEMQLQRITQTEYITSIFYDGTSMTRVPAINHW